MYQIVACRLSTLCLSVTPMCWSHAFDHAWEMRRRLSTLALTLAVGRGVDEYSEYFLDVSSTSNTDISSSLSSSFTASDLDITLAVLLKSWEHTKPTLVGESFVYLQRSTIDCEAWRRRPMLLYLYFMVARSSGQIGLHNDVHWCVTGEDQGGGGSGGGRWILQYYLGLCITQTTTLWASFLSSTFVSEWVRACVREWVNIYDFHCQTTHISQINYTQPLGRYLLLNISGGKTVGLQYFHYHHHIEESNYERWPKTCPSSTRQGFTGVWGALVVSRSEVLRTWSQTHVVQAPTISLFFRDSDPRGTSSVPQ